jgi:TolB protein
MGGFILIVVVLASLSGCSLLQPKEPPLENWEPVASPDGSMIAFAAPADEGYEIYIRNMDTGEITQLTENEIDDWAPNWSPTGDRIVFTSNRDENPDLYIIYVDTLTINRLTTHSADDVNPSWGQNGKILFNSNRSDSWEIYQIDPDGRNLVKITESEPE